MTGYIAAVRARLLRLIDDPMMPAQFVEELEVMNEVLRQFLYEYDPQTEYAIQLARQGEPLKPYVPPWGERRPGAVNDWLDAGKPMAKK